MQFYDTWMDLNSIMLNEMEGQSGGTDTDHCNHMQDIRKHSKRITNS